MKMSETYKAALTYSENGWRVLPIYWIEDGRCACGKECKSPGKHPIPANGLNAASSNPDQIGRWFSMFPKANVGIATGRDSGIWALDIDPHKGGDDSFSQFGEIPECFHSMTGGGGDHYIFAYPKADGMTVPSRIEVLPGLDVRGDGGYIVAPPSNHVSGTCYEWEHGYSPADEDSQELLIELETGHGIKSGVYRELKAVNEHGEPMFQSAPAWNIDAAELQKIKVALSVLDVDSREDWITSGMALHSTGWDQSFELWCEWAIQSDKFDLNDSRRVWRSFSYKSDGSTLGSLYHLANERSPGWTAGESLVFIDDSEQPNAAQAEALAELPFFTAGELLDDDIPPPESWWMDGALCPGTVSLIAGAPKVKKSFFAMGMSMAAACGGEFLEHNFTRPLRIMWVQAEIQRGFLKQRFENLVEPFNPEQVSMIRKNFLMSDRLELILEQENEFLKLARTISYHKPDLVIIDPLFNFTLCEENDASKVRQLLRRIGSMRSIVSGLSVLVVHHAKKEIDEDDPFSGIRGSGAFRGYYDFGVMLTPTKEGHRKVYFDARNRSEIEPMMLDVDERGKWSKVQFKDDRSEPCASSLENMLIDGLERAGEAGVSFDNLETMIQGIFKMSPQEAAEKRRSLTKRRLIKPIGHKKARFYILSKFWTK
ncbi:putative AAA family ATPase [Vibrio chagasii]|nr:putative AAA family ATPase [Vibrio chagasii]